MIESDGAVLLESPCALAVGTLDADGVPDATRGWGVQVLDPSTVRVLLAANATTTIANLEQVGRIALTATHFSTLESLQVKGRVRVVEAASGDDRIRFDRFCAGCLAAIHEVEGSPDDVIRRLFPGDVVACTVDVDAVFDQTPGPGAGVCLAPVGGTA